MPMSPENRSLADEQGKTLPELPGYESILVAVDASDHSNRAVQDAVELAQLWQSAVTGAHVYAAKMHDIRFRQMEGGLPEKYKEEEELGKQRDIHDDLITKGLSVITDSYLDGVESSCDAKGLTYMRRSLEGKNYRELVKEADSGQYDLLIMGSLGLGAVSSSRIGTVCERVARRSNIDTLVIKDPNKPISSGPIVVAVDGSARAYGGLLTGLSIAHRWHLPLHVISAYDPYYHYVAFNRIAGVLSEEAGKVFRFKEQEQLHEDIIDAGLAKIYQGHLDVCESLAAEMHLEIETTLLDGKPYEVIQNYLQQVKPSLLILGKTGIHSDADLDIGGQAENLLRNIDCAVLLSHRTYIPHIELLAATTTSWTRQAEERMENIPDFARNLARMGILRYAQEQGHTVITESIVEQATVNLCPVSMGTDGEQDSGTTEPDHLRMEWTESAERLLNRIQNTSQRYAIRLKAEKKTRQDQAAIVDVSHLLHFVSIDDDVINAESDQAPGCPFNHEQSTADKEETALQWHADAEARLSKVPTGFMRDLTRQRVEKFARAKGSQVVTPEIMSEKYADWGKGSEMQHQTMAWDAAALHRLERIPAFVRGMIMKEMENCARESNAEQVTTAIMEKAGSSWAQSSRFHSEQNPDQYQD